MVPRPAVRRERNNDYSAVGTAGRRTGVTLPPGKLDENGLEEITGLFSSPSKPSPVKQTAAADDVEAQNSSGLTPTQTLSARRSLGAPTLPPPRSASPRKSGISGSARRSNGLDILSPSKSTQLADAEDRENSPTPTPIRVKPRRFIPSPQKQPLQEVVANGEAVAQRQQPSDKDRFQAQSSEQAEVRVTEKKRHEDARPEVVPRPPSPSRDQQATGDMQYEDSMENAMGDDEMEEFLSGIENTIQEASPMNNVVPAATENADGEVIRSIEAPERDTVERSSAPAAAKSKKRKSEEIEEEPTATPSKQTAKKPRATKAQSTKGKAKAKVTSAENGISVTETSTIEDAPQGPQIRLPGLTKDPNTHLSQRQQAELNQIIEKVKARPGKLKSLYVLKRQKSKTHGADDVRSGRAVVKPLAYWSAEQCVYDEGAAALELGTRIPLNPVREITQDKKKQKGRADGDSDDDDAASLNDYQVDGHEESWEKEIGVFRGQAAIWDQSLQTTLEDQEETDLAYHPSSMLTREVQGSTFKFAKLVSTPFFGSGIVDLPPGAVKRPKNSRSMHMCFFVFKGRVTVKMGPEIEAEECETFSIGKGGVFQIPRGNKYSVENVLDKPARIFFSQASETVPKAGDD